MTEEARYCPKCSSSSVSLSAVASADEAKCHACGWSGARSALYAVPFSHAFGGREGISDELFNDIRRLLVSPAFIKPLVSFLDRWGFISLGNRKDLVVKLISRYGDAVAKAMITALIKERESLEKEKAKDVGRAANDAE